MLAAIVRGSLAHPKIVTALSLLIALLGAAALLNARLDVFPDFAPPHVLVQAEAPGLDATQVESLVTRPLEDLLAGAENVEAVRSSSSQGLAAIRWSSDVTKRSVPAAAGHHRALADSSALLPAGVSPPQLSPLSSSMEYLLHFGFTSECLPLELRDGALDHQAADFACRASPRLRSSAATARAGELWVDPGKPDAAALTLEEVAEAARAARR
jgi:multidrug efflux pump subunit AcrB